MLLNVLGFIIFSSNLWIQSNDYQVWNFHLTCLSVLQISEIKLADIPDINLSQLGVTNYGPFSVEVIDPVADYLELLEVSSPNSSA